jgi:hypothetical protein
VPLGKRAVAGEELAHAGRFGGSGHEGLFDCSGEGRGVRCGGSDLRVADHAASCTDWRLLLEPIWFNRW